MVLRRLIARIVLGIVVAMAAASGAASAQTKITLLYDTESDFAGVFIAKDQGYFDKHGLDVDLALTRDAGTVAIALLSSAVQIATAIPPTLLQANDQGLDLVVIAGTDLTAHTSNPMSGFVVREGSDIRNLADLIGKKVGVAMLGGTFDVLARRMLQSGGVDYHRISWVEIPFQQMGDNLKADLVDGVVAPYPFYSRIIDSKVGYSIGGNLTPPGVMPALYLSTRDWASQNLFLVTAFRAALDDAAGYFRDPSHQVSVLATVAKWTKLPPKAVTPASLPASLQVYVEPAYLTFWIQIVREQGLIRGNPDPASLIAP